MSTVEVGVRLAFDPAGPVEPEPSGRTMAFGHPDTTGATSNAARTREPGRCGLRPREGRFNLVILRRAF